MFAWCMIIIILNVIFACAIPWIYMLAPIMIIGGMLVIGGILTILGGEW